MESRDLCLECSESSSQFVGKLPVNLKLLWPRMSLPIMIAASSEKSRFFRASFNTFCIPSLTIRTVFFPSYCSCTSGMYSSNLSFYLVLLTCLFIKTSPLHRMDLGQLKEKNSSVHAFLIIACHLHKGSRFFHFLTCVSPCFLVSINWFRE